jgi:hypothetical protein
LLGPGGRGDVVVGRGQAEEFVAHAAAGEQGFEPRGPEATDDVLGELAVGHADPEVG